MKARRLTYVFVGGAALSASAMGQVPDLLNAFDAGGRALGTGGALNATSTDTLSTYYNPAGLGYLSQGLFGAVYRNLPESRTRLSGDFADPRFDSEGRRGSSALTHLGVAFPLDGGRRGTFGVSYTIGGLMDDTRTGSGLTFGSNFVQNYRETVEAKAEYFTLAYGKSTADQAFSWGVGLQFVQQHIGNTVTGRVVDGVGNTISTLDSSSDETGNGIGLVAGVQWTPRNRPNVSFGLSYRTEVDLQNNDDTSVLYDKIPARLMFGAALRQDGLRNGNDFIVYGAQVQHFFAGQDGGIFDRDPQTTFGIGFEYNYQTSSYRIPLRLGYNIIPAGGDNFGSRNGFAFGFGYRPASGNYTIDLNFVSPQRGGYDASLGITYRFGT